MELEDPFVDEKPFAKEPSRDSIRSFWGLTACLAILAYLGAIAGAIACVQIFGLVAVRFTTNAWRWRFAIAETYLVPFCLVPSVIVAAITPVLNWRGGLVQRFAITLAIAITAMNFAANQPFQGRNVKADILELALLCGLWIVLPLLFLYTPIKTRELRMLVAIFVFVLAFCVSMIFRNFVPNNRDVLYWEVIYGTAMGFALLFRNWGRTAFLESNTSVDQIQRTSTATLLELMAVCSLACVASMYWAERHDTKMYLALGILAFLGPAIVLITMSLLKRPVLTFFGAFQATLIFFLIASVFAGIGAAELHFTGYFQMYKPTIAEVFLSCTTLGLSSSLVIAAQVLSVRILIKFWCWKLA